MTGGGFITAEEALHYLAREGQREDAGLDLIECGFAFSLLDAPERDVVSYRRLVTEMKSEISMHYDRLCAEMNGDDVAVQAECLRQFFSERQGFIGDDVHYDDLQNINLFSVIDRRLGLPISLCILAIGLARSMDWNADGVNFPGHFIMRLEKDGARVMLDPYQECQILEAKDLRLILKKIVGNEAELSADYYIPCTNRDVLLRYQNNLKYRLIDHGQYPEALEIVKRMELIAPRDFRLALDKSVLYARLEQPMAAIEELLIYLDQVTDPHDRADAEAFLYELQKSLN